jgi:hypothetical protein
VKTIKKKKKTVNERGEKIKKKTRDVFLKKKQEFKK